MEEKEEKQVYISSYCKVENGVVVGLDMEKINRKQKEIDALAKKPTDNEWTLKAEIERVKTLLRTNHNSHTYHQNKKYLERLERRLRACQKKNL